MQRSQSAIIFTIMIMAVITAIGLFLAWSYFQRRPDLPAGSQEVIVENVPIVISPDPAQRVRLVEQPVAPTPVQPVEQPPEQPAEQPPEQPAPPPTDTPIPPTATPVPPAIIFIDYLVQPGDTLYGVARRIDTSIALMAQEGIAQDHLIPGQTIKLPVGNPAYCPGRRPYAVAEGDTVYAISRRLNITQAEIQTINGLDANLSIKAAQILCVP